MSVFDRDMAIEQLRAGLGVLAIPEGITELSGDFALVFDWMPEKMCQCSFREIRIPSTVQTINGITLTEYGPDQAPVKRFKKISVAKDNPYYTDVDGVLFTKDLKRLICYPCGKSGKTYVVPDTVEIIDEYAFADNTNLRKVVLPDSLKRIEFHAFFQCEKLAIINLPESLEYIGEGCFELSFEINRLIIPMSMKRILTSLFSDGGIVSIPNNSIELEYDYVPTEYLNMPFNGPAIISNDSEELVDFAESYDYNHFENCFEDRKGIIWANHGRTLISFPADWDDEEYELPDEVEAVYLDAFRGSVVKRFYSNHKVSIIGKTTDTYRNYEPKQGKQFHISANTIFCDDKADTPTEKKALSIKVKSEELQKTSASRNSVNKNNYVFISYSSKNQQMADSVRLLLKENNISCWMAPYDIPAGSRYAYVINDALEKCSCLLLLLTNASQMSQFVEREIERAITYKKPILPMQLEDLELNSGFKFYIGNSQIIAVPEIRGDSPEFCRILSGLSKFVDEKPDCLEVSEDAHNDKGNDFKTQMASILDDDPYYFCKVSYSSSYGGSIFFYSEKSTAENNVRINVTEEFWNQFVLLCKQIMCVLFPEVSEQEVLIKRKKPLGIYECAPDDGHSYYDEKYRINFDVKYIHGKDPEKYDSARIECDDGFEISLFKNGEYVFRGSSDETTLTYYGIDEKALYKTAVAMIKFVSRDPYCMISEAFRRNVFSDGSGGYIVDYLIDGPTVTNF